MPLDSFLQKFLPARRKRHGEYRTCLHCGRQFYLKPARAARDEQFCTRKCQTEHTKVEKICILCGKTFRVNRSMADRYNVCSRKCRQVKQVKCKRCGKDFPAYEKRYDRIYCSEECRRPPREIYCETCGKPFRVIPSDMNRRFCSTACYRGSQSETSIEIAVRRALEIMQIEFQQEYKIGRYSVDFYLARYRIALEVDGDYWHQDQDRDKRKDEFLAKQNLKVVRISESEIKANDVVRLIQQRLHL